MEWPGAIFWARGTGQLPHGQAARKSSSHDFKTDSFKVSLEPPELDSCVSL